MSPGFQITTFLVAIAAIILSCVSLAFCIEFQQDVDKIYSEVYVQHVGYENDIIAMTPVEEE